MEEKIIKKEEKLECRCKGAGLFGKKGALVLTNKELYFIEKNNKIVSVPLDNIISVNTQKGLTNGVELFFITYKNNDKEEKAKIIHYGFVNSLSLGSLSRLKESYFSSWEKIINDWRFSNNEKSSSNLDELEKLANLKEKGIITEEEFNQKKKQLLKI
ncbi:MAG: SHOCT domain-containing protein [Candidatus Staskawiczbacteria bacterium]|nr:SHOCT domain-containing protein [Candidatus Staskawiczbacteria bacterium]